MNQQRSFVSTLLIGALGGAIATMIILSSPKALQKIASLNGISSQNNSQLQPPSTFTPNDSHEAAVTKVVQTAKPAVVSIVISKDVPVFERYSTQMPNGFFNPFGDMFGSGMPLQFQVPQLKQNGTQKQDIGGGSGFLVSADGYIVTNKHVISQPDAQYSVFTNDGKKYDAKVAGSDPANDIAILKIDGTNFPYLSFGDSSAIEVGQSVIAIGNSLGEFRNTVSVGVISGLSRSLTAGDGFGSSEQLDEVIQTDAAINPGNSGGPLLGLNGKVLGVNVAVALGSQNVGFALPANSISSAVDQVKSGGKISRAFLGVRYVPITPAIKQANKLKVDSGVLVVRGENQTDLAVTPGSGANKAGIVEGDIILEADGVTLNESNSLSNLVKKKKNGDTISLKIIHAGEEKKVSVTLGELPQ